MKSSLPFLLAVALFAGCKKKAEESPAAPPPPAPDAVQVIPAADAPPPPPPLGATADAPAPPDAPPPADNSPAPAQRDPGEQVDLSGVRNALTSYMQKTGKVPNDLDELVKAGYLRALPVAPAGYRLFYDSVTVSVSMPKKW